MTEKTTNGASAKPTEAATEIDDEYAHDDGSCRVIPAGPALLGIATHLVRSERQRVVERSTTGKVLAATAGKWILDPAMLPLGYRLRADRTVIPDSTLRAAVNRAIEVLANPDLTTQRAAELCAQADVLTCRRADTPLREHPDNAHAVLRAVARHLLVYRTGCFTYRQRNPLPEVRAYGGVQVQGPPGESGYLEVAIDLGLPPGGWAEESLLDAAETRVTYRRRGVRKQ